MISHHASLSYISAQSYLGSFQSLQLLAAESLRIWRTLLLWIKLDSSFCKKQLYYLFTSQVCFPLNYTEIKSNNLQFGGHFLRLPGDRGLTVGNVKQRRQNNRGKRNRGCYSTSLHITGLQEILALWLGKDLPSFADAESGSLLFLCNFFQNSCFFGEEHIENEGQIT